MRVLLVLVVAAIALAQAADNQATIDFYVEIKDANTEFDAAALAAKLPNGSSVLALSSVDADIVLATPSKCSAGYYCVAGQSPTPCPQGVAL
jgi:hypothetical protein